MNKNRFNFRVWNTIAKVYVDGYIKNNGQFVLDEFSFEEKFGDDWDYITEEENNIVDFCTGLKDKNGRLIYDGDIVQTENCFIYIIRWRESSGNWAAFSTLGDWWNIYKPEEYEIIGNIHENGELLDD